MRLVQRQPPVKEGRASLPSPCSTWQLALFLGCRRCRQRDGGPRGLTSRNGPSSGRRAMLLTGSSVVNSYCSFGACDLVQNVDGHMPLTTTASGPRGAPDQCAKYCCVLPDAPAVSQVLELGASGCLQAKVGLCGQRRRTTPLIRRKHQAA